MLLWQSRAPVHSKCHLHIARLGEKKNPHREHYDISAYAIPMIMAVGLVEQFVALLDVEFIGLSFYDSHPTTPSSLPSDYSIAQ